MIQHVFFLLAYLYPASIIFWNYLTFPMIPLKSLVICISKADECRCILKVFAQDYVACFCVGLSLLCIHYLLRLFDLLNDSAKKLD